MKDGSLNLDEGTFGVGADDGSDRGDDGCFEGPIEEIGVRDKKDGITLRGRGSDGEEGMRRGVKFKESEVGVFILFSDGEL